ncbi:HrpT family type III secretion system protein [Pseudomonas syringae]|uniref:HrpT family type III secretion system protein n=1 Tax=Pseudomonas syringae TaxID=317 RepID=UPI001FD1F744|nr:HrpT family type III secretion system protein [Pseudomonas syringae]
MKALVLAVTVLLLAGCSSFGHSGCTGEACDRPTSTNREVVIWWPPQMRDGLGLGDEQVDFTRVPLED